MGHKVHDVRQPGVAKNFTGRRYILCIYQNGCPRWVSLQHFVKNARNAFSETGPHFTSLLADALRCQNHQGGPKN